MHGDTNVKNIFI